MMSSARSGSSRKTAAGQPASCKYLTALIFPDTQLNVLSFNRCIKSLNGLEADQFLEAVSDRFFMEKITDENHQCSEMDEEIEEIQMYFQRHWYKLSPRDQSVVQENDIDAQILVNHLFKPVLNMSYPDSEKNMVYGKKRIFFFQLIFIKFLLFVCSGWKTRKRRNNELYR
jgi:uncharacterized protein (DUF1015 family)